MKCLNKENKANTKNSYPKDIQDILKAIIKHQNIEDDTEFPFGDEEILGMLEANLVWVMNNLGFPFEKWKALFKSNPKYLKRLSDISMTYSFEKMVENGEAVELQPEGIDGKPIYMKIEEYIKCIGDFQDEESVC